MVRCGVRNIRTFFFSFICCFSRGVSGLRARGGVEVRGEREEGMK